MLDARLEKKRACVSRVSRRRGWGSSSAGFNDRFESRLQIPALLPGLLLPFPAVLHLPQ
jgi:hypothetical protein